MRLFRQTIIAGVLFAACCALTRAENISIVIASNAAPRVQFGAQKVADALNAVKLRGVIRDSEDRTTEQIHLETPHERGEKPESFKIDWASHGDIVVNSADDSGTLYACMELAKQIRELGRCPTDTIGNFQSAPAMTLRGTCIGMQKTFILPGRKVYEYPYTPDLFPWFYDKKLWTEYLDFLAANRMNTLYLWSGHPFASLVRLKDYPYAVEVPDDVFAKNQEQFRWLAQECDKRGIWLVQMFYNILVSKPFADTNHISTQLAAPTPLVARLKRARLCVLAQCMYSDFLCLINAVCGGSNTNIREPPPA